MHVHCTFVCVACVVQHRMTKMVRKYLSKKHVILEEDLLEMIADNTDRSENGFYVIFTCSHFVHVHCVVTMYMYMYVVQLTICRYFYMFTYMCMCTLIVYTYYMYMCFSFPHSLPARFALLFPPTLPPPHSPSPSPCLVVQLRKNPPSPLYRGKRISGTKEKFRKSGM